jgi:hypothetical protein
MNTDASLNDRRSESIERFGGCSHALNDCVRRAKDI